jgi:isoamylase
LVWTRRRLGSRLRTVEEGFVRQDRLESWPGRAYPLGATFDGVGTNFAVYSEVGTEVRLCLFDESGRERVVPLIERNAFVWHAYLPGVLPGQRYGYRVAGPYDLDRGLRSNASKLLLDPYAYAVEGEVEWNEAVFAHAHDDPDGPPNEQDSAPFVPKAVVINPFFEWGDDRRPNIPLHDTVIYELHVKGFTARHRGVPEALRGTYAGLGHPAAIESLQTVGATAVELLPVHQFVHDSSLMQRGLRNYWGYNSIGFFAPHNGYSASGQRGQQVAEFKAMVRQLHRAGIEVILDVVYNHTAEGNHLGPTLSLKGFDNPAYYRLVNDDPRHYFDYTGTGNSLNVRHPQVLQLIMDSLRYWATEMHVDGFRFDLASTLARGLHEVDRLSAFFDLIQQDPVVSRLKLIAEPWDVGEGGYQVGNFPPLWSEWNGKYRDCVRDFWRGEDATLQEFANRLSGSSDLYQQDGRRPFSSINFVTAHDGFTLRDLVSYNDKHNEPNGEDNADGESHNRSWNCGVEGDTDAPDILALRSRQQRNMLTTLLLSQGVPMLLGGDELGRTQGGNNNAYCQDNETSWVDWPASDDALRAFVSRLIGLRRRHAVFRRTNWFAGHPVGRPRSGRPLPDIAWFTREGKEMTEENWESGFAKSIAVFLNGDGIAARDERGQRIVDDSFLLLFNGHFESLDFQLPPKEWGVHWRVVVDSSDIELGQSRLQLHSHAESVPRDARSVCVLQRT